MLDNTKKNDRRISIVLNGQEKRYEELEKDKHAYEHLLEKEISATQEEDQKDEFHWILPENETNDSSPKIVDLGERRHNKKKLEGPFWDDGKSEQAPKLPPTKRKKKQKFDFKFKIKDLPLGIIGIVMSAIIVGVSFGFMMLTIFTGDKPQAMEVINPVQATEIATTEIEAPEVVMNGQIPVLGVEIVQGGAFSLVDKATETAQSIQNKGFAAAITNTTEPIYLFIGLGIDREQANVLAEHYKANGQDVYVKPYAVTTSGTVDSQEQSLFLETSVDLYQQLILLSVNGLANGSSLVTDETLADLKATNEILVSLGNPFKDSEQETLANDFQHALDNAYQSMLSFASSQESNNLWQVQQFLLDGMLAYEKLVKTFT
ncbi:SPOR domain-containing protein [Anaerobacillus alkalidiazotrophicus]|uniref:SPOR domain-containing protein n=1 Tax=Anaerobacillus alkalidiazotrophicus TaxID=472963 RepID=UPI001471488E|nr:SPOR domain-containing protein [Anaerobacillus alkalidiazotrophicus]